MKSLSLWIAALVMSLPHCALAMPPLPAKPLSERVQAATHIFTGTAKKLTVMDKEGEVKPEPEILSLGQYVLLEVQVDEALTPTNWKPAETVKVPYGGGLFLVEDLKRGFLGTKGIYLTTIDFNGANSPRFVSTYSYFLTAPLDKKAEIQALIKPNPAGAQTWGRMEWLAKCMKETESIHVGTTRADVQRIFHDVSSISGSRVRRYAHKDCTFIQLDVSYQLYSPGQKEDEFNPLDKVISVSKPRLDWLPDYW